MRKGLRITAYILGGLFVLILLVLGKKSIKEVMSFDFERA